MWEQGRGSIGVGACVCVNAHVCMFVSTCVHVCVVVTDLMGYKNFFKDSLPF